MRFIHPSAFLTSTTTTTTTTTTTSKRAVLSSLTSLSFFSSSSSFSSSLSSFSSTTRHRYSSFTTIKPTPTIYTTTTTAAGSITVTKSHSQHPYSQLTTTRMMMMMSTTSSSNNNNSNNSNNNNNHKKIITGQEMIKSLLQYQQDERHIVQPELHGKHVAHSIEAFVNADCVCFDVDSTVIQEEGIDVLAEYLGKGTAVSQLTKQAMEGGLKFQDALSARLQLLQPSQLQIESCLRDHPFRLTPGITELIQLLQLYHKDVYFISGGFRIMIAPIAEQLNIDPNTNVIANQLLFDSDLLYNGFDTSEYTSQDMGKPRAIQSLYDKYPHKYRTIVMIGDGMTDAQTKPPATSFIGFGGVVIRPNVQQIADWFITDFYDLIYLLNTYCGSDSTTTMKKPKKSRMGRG